MTPREPLLSERRRPPAVPEQPVAQSCLWRISLSFNLLLADPGLALATGAESTTVSQHPRGSRALSQDEGTFQGSVLSLLISRAPGVWSRISCVDVVFQRHKPEQSRASYSSLLLTILGQEAVGGTRSAKAGFCSCLYSCLHAPGLQGSTLTPCWANVHYSQAVMRKKKSNKTQVKGVIPRGQQPRVPGLSTHMPNM